MKYLDYENIRSRKVGPESSRTFIQKLEEGFWDHYCSGQGIEIGFQGNQSDKDQVVSILPTATGVDLNYPGYDGIHLPFENDSQDYVYSSHVLEHIVDYKTAIQEWFRVLKINGFLLIACPHQWLYEKQKNLPSRWNGEHRRFYTPASLLREVEESLVPNSYRVRLLKDEDDGFDYTIPPDEHSSGSYQILLIVQKIPLPTWEIK